MSAQQPAARMSVSVIVITLGRPQHIDDCLTQLGRLRTAPAQIIVVDASPDRRTHDIVTRAHPHALYVRNTMGPGTMSESRQLGLAAAVGDIVAFIDDDALVQEDWLDALVDAYEAQDEGVGGVGGRADNGIEGEDAEGWDRIGLLLPNGELTGFFAADPGRRVDVDHMLGANHSFRRQVLLRLGGIRGNYPGTCLREESDTCLRVRQAGYRLLFEPRAVVRHVAAPYATKGRRFDHRYLYYGQRNHMVLLARVYGWRDPILRRYVATAVRHQGGRFRLAGRIALQGRDENDRPVSPVRRLTGPPRQMTRVAAEVAGLLAGLAAGATGRRRDRAAGVATPPVAGRWGAR
ncbi:glycosyltransferase family 2 protein [Microbacterium rhizophilus]|uniref:glycosyltransferase family 2 protein n=1 Tax=Microbacterium rhizophilus TaxID=3138934 RepID=UPI0031EB9ED0